MELSFRVNKLQCTPQLNIEDYIGSSKPNEMKTAKKRVEEEETAAKKRARKNGYEKGNHVRGGKELLRRS